MKKVTLFSLIFSLFTLLVTTNHVFAQITGTNYINPYGTNFTGNPGGIAGKTYTTFNNAVTALNNYGISGGSVTFQVTSSIYTESVNFMTPINGTSAANRVIFDGGSRYNVTLTYAGNTPTVYFQGTATSIVGNVTFQNMDIQNFSATYAYAVEFSNYAQNISFLNSKIEVPIASNSSYIPIVFSYSQTSYSSGTQGNNYITFQNNIIKGGYFGVTSYGGANGSSSSNVAYNFNNSFINNTFTNIYYYGVYMYYGAANWLFQHNTFTSTWGTANAYAMYLYYNEGTSIIGNIIYPGCYGLYLYFDSYYGYWSGSYQTNIINNMISNFSYASSYDVGMFLYYCSYMNVWHNSIWVNDPYAYGSQYYYYTGIFDYYCFYSSIKDNLIYSSSYSGLMTDYYPYYSNPVYYASNYGQDYNDYAYTTTAPVPYFLFYLYDGTYSNYYTTLPSFVAANSSTSYLYVHDLHSIDNSPANFYSLTDLHRTSYNAGTYVYSTDIDGNTRSTTAPCIGAQEVSAWDLDVYSELPTSVKVGTNTVKATLINHGYNTITMGTTIYLGYQVNSGTWINENFNLPSNLAPGQTYTYTFTTPWNVATSGTYNLCARISPQISYDPDPSDQLCASLNMGMSGTYTIDNTGAGNYRSFSLAINDMYGRGVAGPVTFVAQNAMYNENITLTDPVPGMSATNTVTFDGQNGAVFNNNNLPIVTIANNSYLIFKNITFKNLSPTTCFGVNLQNNTTYCSFINCTIMVPPSTSSNFIPVVLSNSNSSYSTTVTGEIIDHNLFQGCTMSGGYFGVTMYAPSNAIMNISYNSFIGNTLTGQNYYGFYMYNAVNNTLIQRNSIINMVNTSAYGIYSYYTTKNTFDGNMIQSGYYGIYLYYDNYSILAFQSNTTWIINNMITNMLNPTTQVGIYDYYTYNTKVFHNSIWVNGSTSSSSYAAFYGYYCYYTSIMNNIFYSTNNTYLLSLNTPYYDTCNYNYYLWNGVANAAKYYLPFGQNTYYDLATMKLANGGTSLYTPHDQGSVDNMAPNPNYQPGFISNMDLHRIATSTTLYQVPFIGSVKWDVDNDTRSASLVNAGADEVKSIDVDIASMVPGVSAFIGNDTVKVTVINHGYSTLPARKLFLGYQVNGGTWINDSFMMTSSLATNTTSTFAFHTLWNITTSATYKLCTRILPQVPGDPDVADTLCSRIQIGMSGIYYIDLAGTGNYLSANAALADVYKRGAIGPVHFIFKPGTYTENLIIASAIPGASSTNTITFDGQSSFATVLQNNNNVPIVCLMNVSYVTFTNMTIRNTSPTNAVAVNLMNNANYNSFINCYIQATSGTSTSYITVMFANSWTSYSTTNTYSDYNVFSGNTISGGYMGVSMYAPSSTVMNIKYNQFIKNTFINQYLYSVYMYYAVDNTLFKNNTFYPTSNSTGYCIYSYYTTQNTFDGNTMYPAQYGIYLQYDNYASTAFQANVTYIYNNMISNFLNSVNQEGAYIYYCYNTKFYHNSIWVNASQITYNNTCLYFSTSYYGDVRNNLFYSTGATSYLVTFYSPNYTTCDYNDYAYTGSLTYKFCYYPIDVLITNLATFQNYNSAYSTACANALGNHDMNSINNILPSFYSITDLHRVANAGSLMLVPYIAPVAWDFDGDTRSGTVCVGADELKPTDLDIVSIVPGSLATLGSNVVSVKLVNRGYTTLLMRALYLSYQPDGGSWVSDTFNMTANLLTGQTVTYNFKEPWVITTNTVHNLCVRIYPQIPGDPDPSDQICTPIGIGLSGTYYIDGTGGGNYLSFNAAITDLNNKGVAGPINFIVRPGVYNENVNIQTQFVGMSSNNTITFDGLDQFNATLVSTNNQPAITLANISYITFKNLTIKNNSSSTAYGICLLNGTTYTKFIGNRIMVPINTSSSSFIGVVFSNSTSSYSTGVTVDDYNAFRNNTIIGGYFGISMYGSTNSSQIMRNDTFIGNTLTDQGVYGFYDYYSSVLTFKNNSIVNMISPTGYGMYLYYTNNTTIDGNVIQPGEYGIYLQYDNYYSTFQNNPTYVINNMVSNFKYYYYQYGIYMYYTYHTNLNHNSVWINGMYNSYSYTALYDYYCYYSDIRNNIFYSSGFNFIASFYYPYYTTCDYNLYLYSCPTIPATLCYAPPNTAITSFATFLSYNATSYSTYLGNHDLHSTYLLLTNPIFKSQYDLHLATASSYYTAPYLSNDNHDIDGDARIVSPVDIGADELKPLDLDIAAMYPNQTGIMGANTVMVDLLNRGTNALPAQTIRLGYQVNGGSWANDSLILTSSLSSGSVYRYTFSTKWNITVNSTYQLCTRIYPQVAGDPDPSDMVCTNIKTGMAGVYTIDPAGSGPNNYVSFNAALNDMMLRSVGGACIFNVAKKTFTERVVFGPIPGASAMNTVTFNGLDKGLSILTSNPNISTNGNASTVVFNNAKYITFQNMTVTNSNSATTSYMVCFFFENDASYNTIKNCNVILPATSSYYTVNISGGASEMYPYAGYGSTSLVGSNNIILNNNVSGGGYYGGIDWCGPGQVYNANNSFIGNTITGPYYYGMYFYYSGGNKINYNSISGAGTGSTGYGIYMYYGAGDTIFGNNINFGHMGIYSYYENMYSSSSYITNFTTLIASNFIGGAYTYYQEGFEMVYGYQIKFINNTLWYTANNSSYGNATTSYFNFFGEYIYNSEITNNIFMNSGYGAIFSIYYPYNTVCDYNLYYYTPTAYGGIPASYYKFCYYPYNSSIYDFPTYLSYGSASDGYLNTHDLNSRSQIDPQLVSATNWHLQPNNYGIIGKTQTIQTLPTDIDGDPRCQIMTYLGADNPTYPVLTTGFIANDTMCLGLPQTFLNLAQSNVPHFSYWFVNQVYQTNSENYTNTFTTSGAYSIKLRTLSCKGTDSMVKNVIVKGTTTKPVVEFWSPNNIVEPYYNVNLYDLSKNCPSTWMWTISPDSIVIDPVAGTKDNTYLWLSSADTTQNPTVVFKYPGYYSVCLTSKNSFGNGLTNCKTNYIYVKPAVNMCSSVLRSTNAFGSLYDDGGPSGSHGLNDSCSFLIKPCTDKVRIVFSQFDLAAKAYLRIYDGMNARGIPIWNTAAYGLNGLTGQRGGPGWQDTIWATKTGSAFVVFVSKNTTPAGAGFRLEWTGMGNTVTYTKPVALFSVPDTNCIATPVFYTNNSVNCDYNETDFRWDFDGNSTIDASTINGIYTCSFTGSSATYLSTLLAENCGGTDTFTKDVTFINLMHNPVGDFMANIQHPVMQTDIVTFSALPDKSSCVDTFTWDITPSSYIFVNSTTRNSAHPQVIFNDTICYNVTLAMGNTHSIYKDSFTKTCYIRPIQYCIPAVINLHPDMGISKVTLGGINNSSSIGVTGYTNYANNGMSAMLIPGQKYGITIKRNTNFNFMNISVWIDYNDNGSFSDAGELVAHDSSSNLLSTTDSFVIPLTANLGGTVMRIGTNYNNYPNVPCGPNLFGEFEDYRVNIAQDNIPPVITIIGQNPTFTEIGYNYVDSGATAWDNLEGNITSSMGISNGVNIHATGIYYVTYHSCDNVGNCTTAKRTVIVTIDKTPPAITLKGANPYNQNVNTTFTDPGATAYDLADGNLTSKIVVTGAVNSFSLGTYMLTYTVADKAGNIATTIRTVTVTDSMAPTITLIPPDTMYVNIMHGFHDPGTSYSDNYWPNNKINYVVTGLVDTTQIGTYIITYSVTDASGNGPNTVKRTVIVYDSIAPSVVLNGLSSIKLEVYTPFADQGVNITDNSIFGLTVIKTGSFYKFFPNGIPDSLGSFSVFYQAKDAAGNLSNIVSRTIQVIDDIAPTVALKGDAYTTTFQYQPYIDAGDTVRDNYYPDSVITQVVTNNVNTTALGLYQVTYKATDPSGNVSPIVVREVMVISKSGIDNNSLSERIGIYPNPTKGIITVDLSFVKDNILNISIVNDLGQEVMTLDKSLVSKGMVNVDLSQFSAGIYTVKILSDHGTASKKIVLNK